MKTYLKIVAMSALAGSTASGIRAQTPWKIAPSPLTTRWAKQVSPTNALPEYPRPQLTRSRWQSLNGLWSYGLSDAASTVAPADMSGHILVPYPYESALSGIGKPSPVAQRVWYKRSFSVPIAWKGQNVLLHFGAVNYDSTVMLNGKTLGSHRGGFDGFDFDITPQLRVGENELVVSASNPIKSDVEDAQVIGKQRLHPGSIFYTGVTGIWQSVWLEPIPAAHVENLKITPDINAGLLHVMVASSQTAPVKISVLDGDKTIAALSGTANTELIIPLPNAKLWSPDTPFLYGLKVELGDAKNVDTVTSYAAMRKISLGKDDQGRQRICLNDRFLFQVGALDQGYWPDGIYTAPTDAALKSDIVTAKKLGWNLLRKHAKVEPARWYYWTDRLGMLVWQDMPQMFGGKDGALSDAAKTQFDTEWRRIIAQNYNSPSIVVWTIFNEGWGQHDTERVVAETRGLDPTRLVNNASGWNDMNVGDIRDTHDYPGPRAEVPEARRAAVNGEFGGVTYDAGHRWNNDVMGYGTTLQSSWLATKRFQNLMKKAYGLRDSRGTSAVVYTQLTDVEQEINGALTYDRALIKLDAKIAAAANRGQFPTLPPNPNPEIVTTSSDEPVDWQYTTDQPAADWFRSGFDDRTWKTGTAPFGHDFGNVHTQWTTSNIWIRRKFTLLGQIPAKLHLLVKHDEDADIYINGVLAATLPGFNADYKEVSISDAARSAMRPGQNTFAVHVHQTVGGQGIDIGIVAAH